MGPVVPLLRETYGGPIRCSSLTLEGEEQLIMTRPTVFYFLKNDGTLITVK
jgi:hypothetical protein